MSPIPPEILEWRRRTGADRFDEMWEGVLHMTPSPNRRHQDLEWALETWLRRNWGRDTGGRVYHQINVAGSSPWTHDYRIPDLVLMNPDRFGIDRNEYFEGGPTVVVEIRSPEDETYDKFPFYARLGVAEVWVVERDSAEPELYALDGTDYLRAPGDAEGWLRSEATGVELRHLPERQLELRLRGDEATREALGED